MGKFTEVFGMSVLAFLAGAGIGIGMGLIAGLIIAFLVQGPNFNFDPIFITARVAGFIFGIALVLTYWGNTWDKAIEKQKIKGGN